METTRQPLATLPADAQVFDTPIPADLLGPLFMEFTDVIRFVAPVATIAPGSPSFGGASHPQSVG